VYDHLHIFLRGETLEPFVWLTDNQKSLFQAWSHNVHMVLQGQPVLKAPNLALFYHDCQTLLMLPDSKMNPVAFYHVFIKWAMF
jgi:hypothetical protein